jgi:hypothetical protein
MVTNTIVAQLSGTHQAIARGHQAASVTALCRLLVGAGHDPATPLLAYRDGTLALRVRSIGEGARLTVNDDKFGAPKFRRLKAPPGDVAGSSIEFEEKSEPLGIGVPEEQPACPI